MPIKPMKYESRKPPSESSSRQKVHIMEKKIEEKFGENH
jgi:hypothetical protein